MKEGFQCLSGKGEISPFVVCLVVRVGVSGDGRRPGCSSQPLEEPELCLVGLPWDAITPSSLCCSAGSCEASKLPCKSSSIHLTAAQESTGCPGHTQGLYFEQGHAMGPASDLQ